MVVLFRTFVAAGFMISTGSMAPCLLGYHKQIVCPSCACRFPRGVPAPEDVAAYPRSGSALGNGRGPSLALRAACPNCGIDTINVVRSPQNDGDQMLVHKLAFEWRAPRRWEVAVFRSPHDPAHVYVKRIVGLPNEAIELRNGDVYANGVLQRKSLPVQRSMRIPVYDLDHPPTDEGWSSRWVRTSEERTWSRSAQGLKFTPADEASEPGTLDWIAYRHWIRSGGNHQTWVQLSAWPVSLPPAGDLVPGLGYDAAQRRLSCDGVLQNEDLLRLQTACSDPEFLNAVEYLAAMSHISPVTDNYGYNHPDAGRESFPVFDLMLDVCLDYRGGAGRVVFRMHDGCQHFDCEIDYGTHEICLRMDDALQPVRCRRLPPELETSARLEMSVFDRQVLIAVDGKIVFDPVRLPQGLDKREIPVCPVQMGASDVELQLTHIKLYRDVHYTPAGTGGGGPEFHAGEDEYFMLGDNSPVSLDSRAWSTPMVPRRLLIGRPILVHLPSRQGQLTLGERRHNIRIPDLSRVRYIP